MAKQTVNIGTTANDGTGDPLRTAFSKLNDNFGEVYGNNFVTQDMLSDNIVGDDELEDQLIARIEANDAKVTALTDTTILAVLNAATGTINTNLIPNINISDVVVYATTSARNSDSSKNWDIGDVAVINASVVSSYIYTGGTNGDNHQGATVDADWQLLNTPDSNLTSANILGVLNNATGSIESDLLGNGLQLGSTASTALAGNTTTITGNQANAITANTAKVSNVDTNLGITGSTGARTITSSDGNDAVIPVATDLVSGVMSAADHSKLTGIAANATANAGTVTDVTVGTGLDVADGTTTPDISLDLSELADMTQAVVGTEDELILLDNGTQKRKLVSEITLSDFSNDLTIATGNIGGNAVTPAKIQKIDDNLAATDGHIMVADGTDFTNVALSGDATITNAGALTIGDSKITTSKILDDAVTTDKLANGINTAISANTNKVSNVTTNLSATATNSSLVVNSSDGNNASIPAATPTSWGAMTDEDKDKLDNIASNATANAGTVTSVGINASSGLDAGSAVTSSGTISLSLDLSELTDMTANVVGTQDELILLDNGAERRKLISEITLSDFNNDLGITSNATHTGDVTGDTALTIANDVVDHDNLTARYTERQTLSGGAAST